MVGLVVLLVGGFSLWKSRETVRFWLGVMGDGLSSLLCLALASEGRWPVFGCCGKNLLLPWNSIFCCFYRE